MDGTSAQPPINQQGSTVNLKMDRKQKKKTARKSKKKAYILKVEKYIETLMEEIALLVEEYALLKKEEKDRNKRLEEIMDVSRKLIEVEDRNKRLEEIMEWLKEQNVLLKKVNALLKKDAKDRNLEEIMDVSMDVSRKLLAVRKGKTEVDCNGEIQ